MATTLLDLHVEGLDDIITGLDDAARAFNRELRKAYLVVSREIAADARQDARSGTRAEAHFANAIQPRSTTAAARVAISRSANLAGAQGTFWGAKKYPQFRDWVGASWSVGQRGEGPYVVNETIADNLDSIEGRYAEAYERALKRAFPGGFTGRF